jgi:glycosyltransferase involved in cell wall biosynthesis
VSGPGERLSIGIATPWIPQQTGVADFSTAVFTELAKLANLTVYTTSGAAVADQMVPKIGIIQRSIEEAFADPVGTAARHDAFISIVGNSHYHLPFVQILQHIDSIAIGHDTRMVEFYMALRGTGGVEDLMLRTCDTSAPAGLVPPLDEQIQDMRLLQNAGFWEIARRSRLLILHSPSAAPRVRDETGCPVAVFPFANYRFPNSDTVSSEHRLAARARLGLDAYPANTVHLGSFGFVDPRTKMVDVALESAAWLQQWGHTIALHLVGSASSEMERDLVSRADAIGLDRFQITGFQTDEQYRDWLLAVDLGLQLRISSLLGVSGPLSDMAAYGTPAVASNGLCVDVDTPDYIYRLPDAVSPVIVAEAVEKMLAKPFLPDELEIKRLNYLDSKSPTRYARLLLEQIESTL